MKKILTSILAATLCIAMLSSCNSSANTPQTSPAASPAASPVASAPAASTAPSAAPSETADEPYGTFNNYFTGDIDTINPHIWTQSNSGDLITLTSLRLYFQTPTEDAKAFVLEGELADGDPVQTDSDGKVWSIKLKEDAKWENGDPINVDDVIYSFKMCLDPVLVNSRASQLASDYITIVNAKDYYLQASANTTPWEDVGIKRLDDYTLGLELTDPVTAEDVKNHFNYAWTCLVHEATYEAGMDAGRTKTTYGSTAKEYMSSGRFLLTDWINGSLANSVRNPDYVRADEIMLEGYNYKMVADANTALELFLNGDLDVVSLSANVIEQYMDDPRVMVAPSTNIQTIIINHGNTNNNGILGNVNFRKALFFAIDRQSIAKMTNAIPANYLVAQKCLGDTEKGLTFRQMPESQAYLEPDLGYNPKLAKEYFDKAMEECGLTSLKLTLNYNESSLNGKAASEYLHSTLPSILGDSFTLELMAGPSSVLNTYRDGWKSGDPNSYELQWYGWNTSTSAPWNGMKVYNSTYSNKSEPYYNEEYDALWEKANNTLEAKLDPAYRLELTREMEKIALDEVAACPVYEAPSYSLVSERVQLISNEYIPGYGYGFTLSTITK